MTYDVFCTDHSRIQRALFLYSLVHSFAVVCICISFFGGLPSAHAQATGNTIGVTYLGPESSVGYTLFGSLGSTNTYLINERGELIKRWKSLYVPGAAAYLLENGHMFRAARVGTGFNAGGTGGRVEEFDWDGNLIWSYSYASSVVRQHHDAIKLPNGNVLMVAWELKTAMEALAAGRKLSLLASGNLWPDHLVEIQPGSGTNGTVVWEWHTWNHLIQDWDATRANYGVVADHPELVDVNYPDNPFSDWQHVNAVDYNAELDQVMISVHDFSEIWIIDHSTTTAEAAGHTGGRYGRGGDLLYRWGNPHAYRAGSVDEQKLFLQHNSQWIRPGLPGAGHILIFNNGQGRPGGNYSTIEEIVPPMDENGNYTRSAGVPFGPTSSVWSYQATPASSFYAMNVSGAQRLANGHTMICDGPHGVFFEITDAGSMVWRYVSPVTSSNILTQGSTPPAQNIVFRAPRYAPDFPGLVGRELTSQGSLELPANYEFVMVGASRSSAGVDVRWKSQPERTYMIQFRLDFTAHTWAPIGSTKAIGTEATFTDTDPGRIEEGAGFYRAMLVQ